MKALFAAPPLQPPLAFWAAPALDAPLDFFSAIEKLLHNPKVKVHHRSKAAGDICKSPAVPSLRARDQRPYRSPVFPRAARMVTLAPHVAPVHHLRGARRQRQVDPSAARLRVADRAGNPAPGHP